MNIFSNLTYSRKKDDFSPTVNFEGLERINSLINIAPVNESLTAMFSLDKKFNLFQMKLSGNINAFNTNTIINEEANLNQSLNQNYKTAVKTTFFKKMDVTFGYEHRLNIYESSRASNTFTNYMPFIIAGCTFLKHFDLKTDYHYNAYVNKENNSSSTFQIWNASLRYQRTGRPWEVKFSAYNLLNTQGIRRDAFSENLISSYEYFIQQRYFLLAVKYDI